MPRVQVPPQAGRHPAHPPVQTEGLSALTALDLALVVIFALSSAAVIAQIGKPRQPITPGSAAISVIINTAFIAWVFLK